MGIIQETATGKTHVLEPEHVFGRALAPACSQTLSQRYVSGVHAVLRWTGLGWELKDLNSRNGTYLDGQRIEPTGRIQVAKGSRIGFGSRGGAWELVDSTAPPLAMAVPLDGGEPVRLEGEMIALPSSDDPRATIYRGADGAWLLEQADEPTFALRNAHVFEVLARLWRFCACDLAPATLAGSGLHELVRAVEVERLRLAFAVSRDEEYVHVRATCGERSVDLGAHAYHYLLLTLARQRLGDAAKGLPETSCGWTDVEELAHDPSMAPPRLNIDVFRIRDQFSRLAIMNAASIIERRTRPRQLRIGTGLISIETL